MTLKIPVLCHYLKVIASQRNTLKFANQNAKQICFGAYKILHAQLLEVLQNLFKMSFIEMKKFSMVTTEC